MKTSRLGLIQTEILDTLTSGELAKFKREILQKGSLVYSENLKLVVFKTGSAKISFFEDGEEFILYYLRDKNLMMLDQSCVIEILEDSEIYSVDAKNIDQFFTNFDFNKACSNALFEVISMQRKIMRQVLFDSAKGRIANFLIELALEQDLKQNGYHYVFLPFSLKVLSSFVGLKRQSASTVFNELLKDNIIRKLTQHEFLIIDYEKLQSYTNLA